MINIVGNLTSREFYQTLMKDVTQNADENISGDQFVLNLSRTESIDAMVIPNLLNLGLILRSKTGNPALLYIPNIDEKNKLKHYLKQIEFFSMCEFYGIFDLNTENIRESKKSMSTSSYATYVFQNNYKKETQEDINLIEKDIFNRIRQKSLNFFLNYFPEYNIERADGYVNIAEMFSRALCVNTCIHTQSYAILTLQVNKSLNKICISSADCGEGLYYSFSKKIKEKKIKTYSCDNQAFLKLNGTEADIHAIIESLAYRFADKKYGLYHVLMKTLELNGKIRIHTNSIWFVITSKNCKKIKYAKTASEFVNLLLEYSKSEYVVTPTLEYKGVHIEVEVPYTKEKVNGELADII